MPHSPPLNSTPFSYAQARAQGVSPGRLRGNDLQAPYRGVRHPSDNPLSLRERCEAFQVGMPARAFFSSVTAARLMSLPLPLRLERGDELHVAVPAPGRALATRGIVGHTVRVHDEDVREWHGLRVGSPVRTWCELGTELRLSELVAVADYLVQWRMPLCSIHDLVAGLERYSGRRGRRTLVAALPLIDPRSESPMESEIRVILVTAGVTGFDVNVEIVVDGLRYRGDIVFSEHLVVLEYLGDYHREKAQWRKDVSRASRLREAGWFVLEVTVDDVLHPADFVRRLRRVLAARA